MQTAILHTIYFSIPASIIPLTLLHAKLELAVGLQNCKRWDIFQIKHTKKKHFHLRGFGTLISAAFRYVLCKVLFISQPA